MKGETIKRLAVKALIFAKKASPYVLAAVSATGTIMVTVEAIKAKNPPVDIPENKKITKEKVKTYAKTYWKPVLYCAGSLACQAGSLFIFSKRQKQLVIATHQMEMLLNRYTEAMAATAGVGGAAALNKLEPTNYPEAEPVDVDNDGKELFWDPVFNYWFRTSKLYFTEAAYQTCVDFTMTGAALLSKFYYYMDVDPPTDEDENGYIGWGWFIDDDYRWHDYYGEASGFVGITYSDPKVTSDGLEYREVLYYHHPMFDMNGLMLDINGKNFYSY